MGNEVSKSDDYKLTCAELAQRYSTRINNNNDGDVVFSAGLTPEEVEDRLHRDGPNRLSPNVEAKCAEALKNFSDRLVTTPSCKVIRSARVLRDVDPENLVLGDLIVLEAGDKIPADVRVIQSTDMKVDHAPLTGEVNPLLRMSDSEPDAKSAIMAKNMAFFNTVVQSGMGVGVVVARGDNTLVAQVAMC
eukprot:PhM_4_TR5799/c0_g2_i1/m.26959